MSLDIDDLLRSTCRAVDEPQQLLSGADLRRRARREQTLARVGAATAVAAVVVVAGVTMQNRSHQSGTATEAPVPAETSTQAATSAATAGTVNMQAAEAYRFDALSEMVATSELVVEGEVLSESRGDLEGGHGNVSRLAHVRVLEVYKGTPPGNLTVIEPGWDDRGWDTVINGVPPLKPNKRVLLFLLRAIPHGSGHVYLRVSSAGQFLLNGEESVTTGQSTDPAVERLKKMTPADLREAVREARKEVETKGIKPRKPGDLG